MGRWTYYSPLLLGALLLLALNEPLRALVPRASPGVQWTLVIVVAVLFGIQCQVLMVGAQGAFAQVLPVPRGRSIRGAGAAAAGWLLIGWFGLAGVTVLLGYESVVAVVPLAEAAEAEPRGTGMTTAAVVVGLAALACLAGAIAIYAWNLPAAVADFGDERPALRG